MILAILILQNDTTEIHKIQHNAGIHFINLGTANLYQSTWTFIIHYELDNFIQEYNSLHVCIDKITNLCSRLYANTLDSNGCKTILAQLRLEFREIINSQETLFQPPHRARRALMDGGGYLLNYVLGTLDQRYATTNDKNIKNLKNRQDFLSDLLKNHTSVLENTNNFIHRTDSALQTQFALFNKHLSQIDFDRNHDKLQADLHNHLSILSTYTTLIFTRFRNSQLYILNHIF